MERERSKLPDGLNATRAANSDALSVLTAAAAWSPTGSFVAREAG
uniref:Uncharacterized protein n=1 Tax=Arundo donax TaxID=35708 RepID=A0A0A9AHB1_ARUDO